MTHRQAHTLIHSHHIKDRERMRERVCAWVCASASACVQRGSELRNLSHPIWERMVRLSPRDKTRDMAASQLCLFSSLFVLWAISVLISVQFLFNDSDRGGMVKCRACKVEFDFRFRKSDSQI